MTSTKYFMTDRNRWHSDWIHDIFASPIGYQGTALIHTDNYRLVRLTWMLTT